jgi:hypothetical protein
MPVALRGIAEPIRNAYHNGAYAERSVATKHSTVLSEDRSCDHEFVPGWTGKAKELRLQRIFLLHAPRPSNRSPATSLVTKSIS